MQKMSQVIPEFKDHLGMIANRGSVPGSNRGLPDALNVLPGCEKPRDVLEITE